MDLNLNQYEQEIKKILYPYLGEDVIYVFKNAMVHEELNLCYLKEMSVGDASLYLLENVEKILSNKEYRIA